MCPVKLRSALLISLAVGMFLRGRPISAAEERLFAPHAWCRTDVYEAPDSRRFFPNNSNGATALDALWKAADRDSRPDAEVLQTVRQGLYWSFRNQAEIVRWVGERYIVGKSPQNADAIEIMYHAVDLSSGRDETIHNAVHFGLSEVRPLTPAILHTLADLCMRVEDPDVLDRTARCAQSQRAEILAYLEPYRVAKDETNRGKVAVVAKILEGELNAFAWANGRAKVRRT